ncbi:MAG: hypothetical protein JWQ26_3189 [Modestobacter sp.]|jgi:hypothetical protein|nr:hypothetical protein [Modestobacter sp.]
MSPGHAGAQALGPPGEPHVTVGLVAAPSVSHELTPTLVEDVRGELTARLPDVTWHVQLLDDGLVEPPADDGEIVEAARKTLLTRGWDLVVVLTDLPLRVARRPVVAHASPVHGVAVLSVPALGTVAVRRRLREALLRLVDALLGEAHDADADLREATARFRRMNHRLRELASDVDGQAHTVRFTTRLLSGHLRLLLGMVRANRPWQLAARLSRALIAAGAAGIFALVTSDVWRLADAFGWQRLTGVTAGSVAAIGATLIVGARLWERVDRPAVRQQVVLFNVATTATIVIGVVALYAVLFVLALLAGLLLIVPSLLADALGHPVAFRDYVEVAWLSSSLATVGGALGAGLETDEAVRRAAYTYRTSTATERAAG